MQKRSNLILDHFAERSDVNSDGKITELEALSSINRAFVWKWTHEIALKPDITKTLKQVGLKRENFGFGEDEIAPGKMF